MAGARQPITITIDDREVRAALTALQRQTGDMRPAFREIGEVMVQSTRQRFTDSKAPDGTPWAPNAPATKEMWAKEKKRSAASKKVLVWHGHLRDTLRYAVTANSVTIGTNRIYGAAQQFGMRRGYAGADKRGRPIPWGDIPARPFLGVSARDREAILEILIGHLGRRLSNG